MLLLLLQIRESKSSTHVILRYTFDSNLLVPSLTRSSPSTLSFYISWLTG